MKKVILDIVKESDEQDRYIENGFYGMYDINFKINLNGRKIKEGIYSPYTQAQRHKEIIKKRWLSKTNKFMVSIQEKYFDNYFSKDIIPSNIEQELNTPYQLKDEAKANILSRVTGLSYDELINMDLESIEKYIEQKFGKKPTYDLRIKVDGIPIEECRDVPVGLLDERMNKAIIGPKRRVRKR